MNALQRLLVFLCPIILFLIGLGNVVYEWSTSARHWINIQLDLFPHRAIMSWWLLLTAIPVCMLLLRLDKMFHSSLLVLKADSGQPLKIREIAVCRYIHDRLIAMPYIRKAQVRAAGRGGALALKVRIWVSCRKPLDNIQEQVLNRLVEDARQGFGVSKVLPPELYFESVKVSKTDQPETPASEPALSYSPPEMGSVGAASARTEEKPREF